jgi:hypothetical protein
MYQALAPTLLQRWENFYVIVGSAAAALTGLQFVVIALVAEMRLGNTPAGIDAFSTPTIVHLSTVLLLSAVLCAPWNGLSGIAGLVALCGAAGIGYAGLVVRRALRQTVYRLVIEDWLWHIAFPLTAHAMLLAAGLVLVQRPTGALFAIAAAALLLLVVGIHNAWDTVTYLVIQREQPVQPNGDEARQQPPPG